MRGWHLFIAFIFFAMTATSHAALYDQKPFESAADEARYTTLIHEVRCIVCQNQSLADSSAPLAKDLREKIHTFILQKKSNEEIKDYLVKRYSEFILLRPRLNSNTYLLWIFPLVCFIAALITAIFFNKRRAAN